MFFNLISETELNLLTLAIKIHLKKKNPGNINLNQMSGNPEISGDFSFLKDNNFLLFFFMNTLTTVTFQDILCTKFGNIYIKQKSLNVNRINRKTV